jgi:hypothetical protein
MKRFFLPFIMLMMTTSVANAGGIVSSHSSSVQLTVDAARTQATRLGSNFSISGNGINTTNGTTAGTVSGGTIQSGILNPGNIAATQANNGDAFSLSTSYTQGDAIITSAPATGSVSPFSSQFSTAAGVAGSLAGTLDHSHTMTITAGGAGTTATGQFVTEITVID